MIHCTKNNGRIVTHAGELPQFKNITALYGDFETCSGDDKLDSLNPWHHCFALGLAVSVDDAQEAWYVPINHYTNDGLGNLPFDVVREWWGDLLARCSYWVNQNVKYDAHVSTNALGVPIDRDLPLVDTLTLSKLIDSDMQYSGGYGLTNLSDRWLHRDISEFEKALEPYTYRRKDYGHVPPDIMGEYACEDIFTTRILWNHIQQVCPEESQRVWNNEIRLTNLLYRMEQRGICVDVDELRRKQFELFGKLINIEERLEKIVGRSFRPHVNEDCFEVICGHYGCPVLGWTKGGSKPGALPQPSFDKYALEQYLAYPFAPHEVIRLIQKYREWHILNSYFVDPYIEQQIDGVLHSTYNQCVRTGRMSCAEPNAMQLSKEAKELIHPRAGCALWSKDASQIEFRLITHYMQHAATIDAYTANPDTDFHQWVADTCETRRKPAKQLNFMMAYGGGKKKTTKILSNNADVTGRIKDEIDAMQIPDESRKFVFEKLAAQRAGALYDRYHLEFPTLKRTSYDVAKVCRIRGYARNLLGRRRHLPRQFAHVAFNSINQSSAADIIKERMIELDEAYRGTPLELLIQVHDELVTEGPAEALADSRTIADGIALLERPLAGLVSPLRVPLRFGYGVSAKHWRDASDDEKGVGGQQVPHVGEQVSDYPFYHLKNGTK